MTVPHPLVRRPLAALALLRHSRLVPRKGASTRTVVVAAPPAGWARAPSPRF